LFLFILKAENPEPLLKNSKSNWYSTSYNTSVIGLKVNGLVKSSYIIRLFLLLVTMRHVMELSWSCPAGLSCSCLGVVLELSWSCPGVVLELSWSCPEVALELSWSCPGVVQVFSWSCLEVVLKLSWGCPEVVLKLSWSFPGVVLYVLLHVRESTVMLMEPISRPRMASEIGRNT